MKITFKKVSLSILLCALSLTSATYTMSLQDISNTITHNVRYVISLPTAEKRMVLGGLVFAVPGLFEFIRDPLGNLTPTAVWSMYSGGGFAFASLLYREKIAKNEFISCCSTNEPEKIVSLVKNYHKHDYKLSLYSFIEQNQFQAIKNAISKGDLKMALFLILHLHRSQDEKLLALLEDTIHWSALKNEKNLQTEHQKTLDFYQFCSAYRKFYNQLKSTCDENMHLWHPLSVFPYSPFDYDLNNTITTTMVTITSDPKMLLNYFICACLAEHDAIARHIACVLKNDNKTWNVNDVTYEGESLLHHAARQNNPTIIKLLFELNHAYAIKNNLGQKPLEIAQQKNNLQAIDELLTQQSYLQSRVALRKSFKQKERNFNDTFLINTITSYLTPDDFRCVDKNKETYIGLM